MKKLLIIAAALLLLVLFPGLAVAVATAAAHVTVWWSTQPVLVGFALGALAWPHLRRRRAEQ